MVVSPSYSDSRPEAVLAARGPSLGHRLILSLRLLLGAPCYSLTLCLLSLLLSLRLLRLLPGTLRPLPVNLLRPLLPLKLAHLPPRILVALRCLPFVVGVRRLAGCAPHHSGPQSGPYHERHFPAVHL